MKLTAPARRLVIAPLAAIVAGKTPSVEEAQRALDVLRSGPRRRFTKSLPEPSIRERKEKKKQSRREETRSIRERVMDRALGVCEVRGRLPGNHCWGALELDHWEGGAGRKLERQSPATTWMLCRGHHLLRTNNLPDAATWNAIRAAFCAAHNFSFEPHVVHQAIARRG